MLVTASHWWQNRASSYPTRVVGYLWGRTAMRFGIRYLEYIRFSSIIFVSISTTTFSSVPFFRLFLTFVQEL